MEEVVTLVDCVNVVIEVVSVSLEHAVDILDVVVAAAVVAAAVWALETKDVAVKFGCCEGTEVAMIA